MKKYLSGLITGIALTTLVGSLVIGASAISSKMTIEVDPINIMVNGEIFEPKDVNGNPAPVFAYNGTTMAPLRALAEAYGLEVGYDAGSNMATVGKTDAKTTAATETTTVPDTTVKTNYDHWSAEEKAIYKELVEEWEYTYEVLDESKSPEKSVYTGDPKSGETEITKESIQQCGNYKELIYRVISEVDTRHKKEVVIEYPFGGFASISSGDIVFLPNAI